MISLSEWCLNNRINLKLGKGDIHSVEDFGEFLVIEAKGDVLIDAESNFILSDEERIVIEKHPNLRSVVFEFGGLYYFTDIDRSLFLDQQNLVMKLNDFKYVGKAVVENDDPFSHLGIHGEYELLNGSGLAEDWVKKAKFYGHKSLGICDKNTLAGTLSHQIECEKAGIKPILGETVVVKFGETPDGHPILHEFIVYAATKKGWRNILKMNRSINIDNDGFVDKDRFLELGEGVILILSTNSIINEDQRIGNSLKLIIKYKKSFHSVYYQIDSANFFEDRKYSEYANGIKNYMDKLSKLVGPVLIGDSYYLDKEYYKSQMYLNDIKRVRGSLSHDQYYKCVDDHIVSFDFNYSLSSKFVDILDKAIKNTVKIADDCNYSIQIGSHKLPEFECEGDKNDLFFSILEEGLSKKVLVDPEKVDKQQEYLDRLEEEAGVIVGAGFIDYFLILWDIIRWSKEQGYLVGPARGSVAGSLIAYLLDITTVDPIQYDLLFERFLNKTRVSGERSRSADALPDIDVDFEGLNRDEVKRYMELKYGKDHVVSIGTYNRLKLKSAIKGFGRSDNLPFQSVNYVTKKIEDRHNYVWDDLFTDAQKNGVLKSFVKSHPDLINTMKPVLNQAQTSSIHASAVVIVPKKDEDGEEVDVFDWMPVRKIWLDDINGFVLVSEWEGKYIERAGFLKEDILGLAQLDKFTFILNLIKRNRKKTLVLEDIPLKDPKVYDIFAKGYNEDVFQFGTSGLQRYSRFIKPDGIEDLIAMNALYRPGPMGSNAHQDYGEIKHGIKDAEFDFKLEGVTKNTHGLYVYQEQIMQAVNVLGGLSLSEADEVRTIMKKFDKVKMKTFKEKFLKGAKKNGCGEEEANRIWEKLEKFSGYGFNRSHAASYSIMGYWCQYLKCYYPEEFYTSSLNFAKSENYITNILDEIETRKIDVTVILPDVNKSTSKFISDPKQHRIYWSFEQVRGVGPATTRSIVKERISNGKFKNIHDFLDRMRGTGTGKGAATHLVLAGAFDGIYGVEQPKDRLRVILDMYRTPSEKQKIRLQYTTGKWERDYAWILEQKRLTGYGKVDFKSILIDSDYKQEAKIYLSANQLAKAKDWQLACVAGRVMYVDEANTKRGKSGIITMESNNKILQVRIWADVWEEVGSTILSLAKKKSPLLAISGKVKYDTYLKKPMLFSDQETTEIIEL